MKQSVQNGTELTGHAVGVSELSEWLADKFNNGE